MTANVFVLGLDELNRHSLQRLPGADELAFHQLLSIEELQHGDEIPVVDLIDKATRRLERFDGRIDALLGYWDFPVSCMLPLLCQRFGLPSTSLESRLKCEHKYWSRLEQHKVLDEQVNFDVLDPFDDDPLDGLTVDFPFWMKPVKAFSSEYAYPREVERVGGTANIFVQADSCAELAKYERCVKGLHFEFAA